MHEFLMTVVVSLALTGCDSKSEVAGGTKPPSGGEAATVEIKQEPAKPAAPKHPWGSFKKGSTVKIKKVSVTAGITTESTTAYTLLDVTADEAIVQEESAALGIPSKTTSKIPLKAPEGGKAAEGPKPTTGTEEIEVAGKKLKCTWSEITIDSTVSKTWICEDVPGHLVKSTSKTTGFISSSTTLEVLEFSSK